MRATILFLIISTVFRKGSAANSSSIVSRLSDMLQYLCPGANVCRENATRKSRKEEFTDGLGSCCSECSCGSNCEENGDCCYPSKQPYTGGNRQYNDAFLNWRDCLYPTTLYLQGEQQLLYQPYYMITSVYSDKEHKSNLSCGDIPVASWGSLFPVYSARRNQIYKNTVCATSDGVTDGKLWDVVLTCGFKSKNLIKMLHISDLVNPTFDSDFMRCYIKFIYPGNIKEMQPFKCYRDVIDVCPELFQMKDKTGFSEDEIIQACTSGLTSPYRKTKMYANVFCYICNNERFARNTQCSLLSPHSHFSAVSFSGFIDAELFLTDGQTQNLTIGRQLPTVCKKQNKRSCRPVYCPSGQSYDISGKCKHTIKVWYNQTFAVGLNLTMKKYVNIIDLLQSYDVSVLNSPWPRNWHIQSIDYDITNSNEKNTYVNLVYITRLHVVRPTYLIHLVEEMVKQEWVFEVNKTKCVLKSNLMTLLQLRYSSDSIRLGNRIENISFPSYSNIYEDVTLGMNIGFYPILINRLLFCNQVELTHSEFSLSENKLVLFNVITQLFIFNGEFTLTETNEAKGLRARICIENSGFVAASASTVSNTKVVLRMLFIWISFSACCYKR